MKQRSVYTVILASAALLIAASPGSAAARRNLPGCVTNAFPANDDGSTSLVPIGFTVNLFGANYSSLYVNNNGNVTFSAPLGTFTPFGLIGGGVPPILAPFFADVDTRGAGSQLVTYGNDTLNGRPVFCVEWANVGYYSFHADKLNSFELVMIDRSDISAGAFDFEFNYDSVTWETGDASGGVNGFGGTVARAGYSNGQSSSANVSFEFQGSGVSGAFLNGGSKALIANSLNSNVAGRYLFSTRGGVVNGGPSSAVGTPATTTSVLILTGAMLIGIVAYLKTRMA